MDGASDDQPDQPSPKRAPEDPGRPESSPVHQSRRPFGVNPGAGVEVQLPVEPRFRPPAQPTRLIGRAELLNSIRKRLLDSNVRLVTLTGPAGAGKTRLAIALAEDLKETYRDGAYFLDLGPLRDPGLVLSAIARMFRVSEAGSEPLRERLHYCLGDLEVLIVLDNFEHLLPAGQEVARLLAACPALRVLATSREPLHLRWEHQIAVPPLRVPDPKQPVGLAELVQVPAVTLWVDRVHAIHHDFRLTEFNASDVSAICQRLDGLPLAIELAAPQAKVFAAHEVLGLLNQRLDFLQEASSDEPERHRSLRAAIAWSVELLSPAELRLFRRFSIFPGGATLEAIRSVVDPTEALPDLVALLRALVDKSLVYRLDSSDAGRGSSRFRMLDTVREYAAEQLVLSGELSKTQLRLATYFVNLARQAEPEFWGNRQLAWRRTFEAELDNVRAVLDWSLSEGGDPELGLQLGGWLWRFWDLSGHLSEGRHRLQALLDRTAPNSPARVPALLGIALLTSLQGEGDSNLARLRESEQIARELDDPLLLCLAISPLGTLMFSLGNLDEATRYLEEAVQIARRAGLTRMEYGTLHWLGEVEFAQGAVDTARNCWERGLELAQQQGDAILHAFFLYSLSRLDMIDRRYDLARSRLRESLLLRRDAEAPWGISQSLEGLAVVALAESDPERAARLLGAAEVLLDRIGAAPDLIWRPDHATSIEKTRELLGEERLIEEWSRGRAFGVDEAIGFALGCGDALPEGSRERQRSLLTRREIQVAGLVTRGLTSRQIAEELVISERTADTHIDHIRSKLGLRSRIEVATWAIAAGLVPLASDGPVN